MRNKSGLCLVLVSTLAISACSKNDRVEPAPAPIAEPVPATTVGTTREALNLMGMGEETQARQILEGILARNPGDRIAKKYLDQIVVDPNQLLGGQSYKYRVQSGDTMASIAQNTLGDSSLFYALARYNGISDPRRVDAGQIIRIPGTKPKAKRPDAAVKPAPPNNRTAPQQTETGTSNPAVNPRRATQLRAEGLAALNRGSVSRAVNLLSQANRLDPSNRAIAADLARAKRIQKTVAN
ncbi:LysM peptidoglycan-binding domain-containing protein [Tritonibacter scottomollicae]|uniref:LysM peptidoglycan-binding domain-containing protein n=1 Tax=Tritonibacter scottomollicae TaxID=483013 RepID=UPI003AA813AB